MNDESNLNPVVSKEDVLLGQHSPFIIAMRLNMPGFIFALIHAFQDSVDLYFIKKGYGTNGITVVSITGIIRMLVASFSSCEFQGITKKFSELFAKHDKQAINELFVEVFRFNLIYAAFMTTIILSITKPLISKMGIPDSLLDDGRSYLLPISFLPLFVSTLHLCTGVLLASGRSIVSYIMLLMVMTISLSSDPLLIYAFQLDLKWIGFAFASGPSIVSTVLFILFISHAFSMVTPKWSAFLRKPSSHFWSLIKLMLPSLNTTAFGCLSPILFSMLLKRSTLDTGNSAKICSVYSTTMKVFQIMVVCINNGLAGLIPSATYALHKKNTNRAIEVVAWSLLLPLIAVVTISLIMVISPYTIMKIWINDELMVSYVPKISRIPFYTSLLEPFIQMFIALAIVFNRGVLASICPLVKVSALIGSAALFSKYSKSNPLLILHSYNIQDLLNFLCSLTVFVISLRRYRIMYKLEDNNLIQEMI
ncbi:hypothetical protein TVAG_364470 [Trichomonas vaginalis G3]|uniref:MatE family protein n=1 Tax=Trichomonas vaginalis (strain ATCC PRA-98 / G3) TaxID=412133 RepID=A2E9F8_TRIV3|nr:multidrug resistance protein YPNP-related family [Trichomonas vaginalis G3]EAY10722.1 hypothetical protein TVAG_364470 [Trichomonas vaginalis G3]KAI5538615.1 multidrug resistance protein YPNP-related family [Trichomonas vaginalis G3]|eukprot:XP_001322945.1 hypothetical protein [Trichomonas vaginalis G3]